MRLGTAIGGVFWSVLGSELLSLQEEEELWLFAVKRGLLGSLLLWVAQGRRLEVLGASGGASRQ